jgi:hypothetical protein
MASRIGDLAVEVIQMARRRVRARERAEIQIRGDAPAARLTPGRFEAAFAPRRQDSRALQCSGA